MNEETLKRKMKELEDKAKELERKQMEFEREVDMFEMRKERYEEELGNNLKKEMMKRFKPAMPYTRGGYLQSSYTNILHITNGVLQMPMTSMIDDSIKEVDHYKGIVFSDYTCIIISYLCGDSIDNDRLGKMLADYVDDGGNVVLCMWSNVNNWNHPAGRFTSYHPFLLQGKRSLEIEGGKFDKIGQTLVPKKDPYDSVNICMRDHPIMKNVNTLVYDGNSVTIRGEGIQGDTEVVGRWQRDGGDMIGVRYDKKGIIISIGCVCGVLTKGDIYELLRNAVRYRKYIK